MRRQSTGRPGSHLIHPKFATAVRVTAERGHTSACTIRRPTGTPGTYNAATGDKTGPVTAPPHYTGPCGGRRASAGEREQVIGSDTLSDLDFVISLGVASAPQTSVGDIVRITSVGDFGDPLLVGKEMRVAAAERDLLTAETILWCRETQS